MAVKYYDYYPAIKWSEQLISPAGTERGIMSSEFQEPR